MNKKYIFERVTLIVFGLISYFLLINFEKTIKILGVLKDAFLPVMFGAVFAFFFNIPMSFLEKKIAVFLKKIHLKDKAIFMTSRATSLLVVVIVFISVTIISMNIIIPQVIQSMTSIVENIPTTVNSIEKLLTDNIDNKALLEWLVTKLGQLDGNIISKISEIVQFMFGGILDITFAVTAGIINAVIGLIIAIYILLDKERLKYQLKLVVCRVANDKVSKSIISILKLTYSKLRRYIGGQVIDASILFIMLFVAMSIFNMPYKLLISSVVGISAVIPIFGPFIGALISIVIMFIGGYSNIGWFIVLVIAMQQIEGNIIYPIVVGNSLGLSSFYIIVAVIVFSSLFGILGIVIGVPLFGVFYEIIAKYIKRESLIE